MPLPTPRKNEEQNIFISRCTKFAINHGMPQKQAVAACYSTWRRIKNSKGTMSKEKMAKWTRKFINDLPDSAFAYISPGGEKDSEGKTVPRSLRHLPYKDASGKVDPAHLRNALARLPVTQIPTAAKTQARNKLIAAAKKIGVKVTEEKAALLTKNENKNFVITLRSDEIEKSKEMSLMGFEGVTVSYGIKDGIAKIEKLIFCHKIWELERVRDFFNSYAKQLLTYEEEIEKKLQYVENAIVNDLSSQFKIPYEFTFVALGEGEFNKVYYTAEELAKAYETLQGKPITIDHSKSVRDVIGEVKEVRWNDEKKRIEGVGVIKDKEIAEKIHSGLIRGVSVEVMVEYIKTKHGTTASDLEFVALSIVKNPACNVPNCGINVK